MIGIVLTAVSLSSCESIYDYLDPCPHGVSLRFVYNYNLEYANAFPSKVDCLTLLIYDSTGNYVDMHMVTGKELADESYRMKLELDSGTYNFIAYGGMACEKRSFVFGVPEPESGANMKDVSVVMDADLTSPVDNRLHNLFYGKLTLETADMYNEGVVEMIKNTNNIRIVLQQMDGNPVNADDFNFSITDDNSKFAWDNNLIANGPIIYSHYDKGQTSTGVMDNGQEVIVAYAEFSTSRLMYGNPAKLLVNRVSDDNEVINIPLNNYLLLLKSELYSQMKPQEFFDRVSEWTVIFFLDKDGCWLKSAIKINDWTIRINDSDM